MNHKSFYLYLGGVLGILIIAAATFNVGIEFPETGSLAQRYGPSTFQPPSRSGSGISPISMQRCEEFPKSNTGNKPELKDAGVTMAGYGPHSPSKVLEQGTILSVEEKIVKNPASNISRLVYKYCYGSHETNIYTAKFDIKYKIGNGPEHTLKNFEYEGDHGLNCYTDFPFGSATSATDTRSRGVVGIPPLTQPHPVTLPPSPPGTGVTTAPPPSTPGTNHPPEPTPPPPGTPPTTPPPPGTPPSSTPSEEITIKELKALGLKWGFIFEYKCNFANQITQAIDVGPLVSHIPIQIPGLSGIERSSGDIMQVQGFLSNQWRELTSVK